MPACVRTSDICHFSETALVSAVFNQTSSFFLTSPCTQSDFTGRTEASTNQERADISFINIWQEPKKVYIFHLFFSYIRNREAQTDPGSADKIENVRAYGLVYNARLLTKTHTNTHTTHTYKLGCAETTALLAYTPLPPPHPRTKQIMVLKMVMCSPPLLPVLAWSSFSS